MKETVSIKISQILDKHLPSDGIGTEREKTRILLHQEICNVYQLFLPSEEETKETPQSTKLALTAVMQRIAREYFTRGQNTPKGGMAPAGDPLWGLKSELETNYKEFIDLLTKGR